MRRYIAEVVELILDLCCALVNHAGGCWLVNRSPLARLHNWAIEVRDPIDTHREAKDVTPDDPPCSNCGVNCWTSCTGSTYSYCGSCGRTKRLA